MKDIAWVAVCSVAALVLGLISACYAVGMHDWYVMALAGVLEIVSCSLALLSWREER